MEPEPLRFLVGETASGKSEWALEIAERAGCAILSLDSMLVYCGMDLGTAKPTAEERARVPHRLIDRVQPHERYDVRRYLQDAREALAEVREKGLRPLFVGGTGLYLKVLTHGLFQGPPSDPEVRKALQARAAREGPGALWQELDRRDPTSAQRIHPNDAKRLVRALEVLEQTGRPLSSWQREWRQPPDLPHRMVGIRREPEELERRIAERARRMLERGWIEEVRAIREDRGFGPTAIQAVGYREVLAFLEGDLDRARLEERVVQRTRQLARRQRTWFRSFPGIRWLDPRSPNRTDAALAALGWSEP